MLHPGDSGIIHLIFVYNTSCNAIDTGKEESAVFCDISKAFDRVWNDGLIHKLKVASVKGEPLSWIKSYLSNRRQRVVLLETTSDD